MFIILNHSTSLMVNFSLVILSSSLVILSEAKNLLVSFRAGSVKNLIESMKEKTEILRLTPQNDIMTQSHRGRGLPASGGAEGDQGL